MTAYKDEKNKAYTGWTLNLLSILVIRGPIGDLPRQDNLFDHTADVKIAEADSKLNSRSHLQF
jgi:hypothetical protein